MERIITIEVPKVAFMAIEEPFESGDPATAIGVRAEVGRVLLALKTEGLIEENDDITVNLHASDDVLESDLGRIGQIETIYREDENGKGAIDSSKVGFTVELVQNGNN